MFTVKYRDSDGNETLYSAEKVEVEHKGDPLGDGIFLDRSPPCLTQAGGEVRTSREIILFSNSSLAAANERVGGKVWVMNEAGATVAVYDL